MCTFKKVEEDISMVKRVIEDSKRRFSWIFRFEKYKVLVEKYIGCN